MGGKASGWSSKRIAIIGNVNVDFLLSPVSVIPPPGEEWLIDAAELRPGGGAANTGLTLAALGAPPTVAGCVGDDALGRSVQGALSRAGISNEIPTVPGWPTGVSVAFETPERDRSFLTALGSLAAFERSLVPPAVVGSDLVLLCGYFLLPRLQGRPSRDLLREVRSAGGTTLLDCGWDPGGWAPATLEDLDEVLEATDVFLPNEAEARALSGERDPSDAARALQRRSRGWVVIKRGRLGCLAVGPEGDELAAPAPSVDARDTTGAGDAFNAGVLYARAVGWTWEVALEFAALLASTVVSRPSDDRYPSLDDVVNKLSEGSKRA